MNMYFTKAHTTQVGLSPLYMLHIHIYIHCEPGVCTH